MISLIYKGHKDHNGRGAFYYSCPNSASEFVELITSKGYSINQIQVRYPNSSGSTSDRDIPVELVGAAEEKLGGNGIWSIKIGNNDGKYLIRLNTSKQEMLLVTPVDSIQCLQTFTSTLGVGDIPSAAAKKKLTIRREQQNNGETKSVAPAMSTASQQPTPRQMPFVAAAPVSTPQDTFNEPNPLSRYASGEHQQQPTNNAVPYQRGAAAMFSALSEKEQKTVQSKHILLWVLAVIEIFSAALPFSILAIRSLIRAKRRNKQQLFTQCLAEISTARLAVGLGAVFWGIMFAAIGGMLTMFFL